jgi:hypothetical protein
LLFANIMTVAKKKKKKVTKASRTVWISLDARHLSTFLCRFRNQDAYTVSHMDTLHYSRSWLERLRSHVGFSTTVMPSKPVPVRSPHSFQFYWFRSVSLPSLWTILAPHSIRASCGRLLSVISSFLKGSTLCVFIRGAVTSCVLPKRSNTSCRRS